MKKTITYGLIIMCVFVFSAVDSGYAFLGKKKTEEAESKTVKKAEKTEVQEIQKTESKVEEKAVEKKDEKVQDKERALKKKKKAQLDNTMWDITLIRMSGEGKKKSDVLVFEENRFYSQAYMDQGFSATNYTLNVKEEEAVVWETMQTSAGEKVIFWRGEIDPKLNDMRGVLSVQVSPGKSEDFSFISNGKKPFKK
ncbi:MAG: hypothetical protein ABII88_07820 [Candidatus Omnitrophota bacterium]